MLILKKRKHRTARIQCEELVIMNSAKMISLNSEILFKSFKLFACLNQRDENSMQPIILSHFLVFPKLGDFGQNVQIQKENKLEYLTNNREFILETIESKMLLVRIKLPRNTVNCNAAFTFHIWQLIKVQSRSVNLENYSLDSGCVVFAVHIISLCRGDYLWC